MAEEQAKRKTTQTFNISLADVVVEKPVIKEDKKLGVVPFGKHNSYPELMVDLYLNESTKHSAIIRRKAKMSTGNGWTEPEDINAQAFLNNVHGSHPANKLVQLIGKDYEIHNRYALIVRWNPEKTFVAAYDYIPVHKVVKGTQEGVYWFSENWANAKHSDSNTKMYFEFDTAPLPEDYETFTEEQQKLYLVQILYFEELEVGVDTYVLPSYNSGLRWILADGAMSTKTLTLIKKNFAGGYHLDIRNGIPAAEEMQDEKRAFLKEHTGDDAESIVVTFSEPEGEPAKLTPLPSTGNENMFEGVEERAAKNIFIAHEVVSPILFGIMTPGQLGGLAQMEESLFIFQAVYVDQRQMNIEATFTQMAEVNGIDEDLILNKFTLGMNQLSPAERVAAMTEAEKRVAANLDEINVDVNEVAEALGALSPLVATKILENMSPQQILDLVGIKDEKNPAPEATEPPQI